MSRLEAATRQVMIVSDYQALFGAPLVDKAAQTANIRRVYRQLSRVLHPDMQATAADVELASPAFARLHELYEDALKAVANDTYGQPAVLVTISSKRFVHKVLRPIGPGNLCMTYHGHTTGVSIDRASFIKIAQAPGDRDLLQAEATALKKLHGQNVNQRWAVFVPELLDSFSYVEPGKPARSTNVISLADGFYDLAQVKAAFPGGFDLLQMIWIWRRLLVALGHAHDNGVIHGAVLPEHIMVLPSDHGLLLVDWCYASVAVDNHYPSIKAIVAAKRDWYPTEVLAKQAPSPATDIAMAARSMIDLMGGDAASGTMPSTVPKAFRAFFRGCLQAPQSMRPDDAWTLLEEFDELLEQLGTPYYPRRFRPFTMPTGTV